MKLRDQIDAIQAKSVNIMKKVNEYKENNVATCRYAYIQFQSFNGKEKFRKAMNLGRCRRCCVRCRGLGGEIEHKYIAG